MSDHVYDLGPVISDGLWVVRWIDGIPANSATGDDPQLRFWFSRIYNPAWRDVPFARAIEGPPRPGRSKSRQPTVVTTLFTNLHVGALTELRVGMVVEDGRPIGWLKADERDFAFVLPRALPGPHRGMFPGNTPARDVLGIETGMNLIPLNGYRHGCDADTFVTVLHDPSRPGRALIVPSAEVMRAFLAPTSEVARDLVRFAPPHQLREIVRSTSAVISPKLWRLDLAETIAARHAPLIANLYEPFSPFGSAAAAEVHATKFDDLKVKGRRTARLAAMIPFTNCTLRFRAKVISLSEHHDLCVEITRVTWPYLGRPEIEVVRWKPEPEPGQGRDMVPGRRFKTRPERETTLDPNNDPDHRSEVTTFAVAGVVSEALPNPTRVDLTFRPDGDRQVIPGEIQREAEASLGASAGGTHLAAVALSQLPNGDLAGEPCPRFAAAVAILTELKTRKAIVDFSPVAAPSGYREAKRGDLPVWRLGPPGDRGRAWVWLDRSLGVRRTLLVCDVTLASGQRLYWLNVEPGQDPRHDICSTLLVVPRPQWGADMLEALVTRIEEDQRVTGIEKDPDWKQRARIRRWFLRDPANPKNAGRAITDIQTLAASA